LFVCNLSDITYEFLYRASCKSLYGQSDFTALRVYLTVYFIIHANASVFCWKYLLLDALAESGGLCLVFFAARMG